MRYKVRRDVFIRREMKFGENNLILFSSETGDMFEANEAINDIIELCEKSISVADMAKKLECKYTNETNEELLEKIQATVDRLQELSILEAEENNGN